jgi:hypothetical protein
MRVQRIVTKQGHPVPKTAGYAKGPFPPELYQKPELITEYQALDDDVPSGATAQNNFVEPRAFKCKFCGEVMYEHKTVDHICEALNGEHA